MNFLPKIKHCPNCSAVNILRINGIVYKNNFQSLTDWSLKKVFNCRKCKVELGLFINNLDKQEKLIWLDFLQCEEDHLSELNKLNKSKNKYKEKKNIKEFQKISKEIEDIQNQIRSDQIKVKIKLKIQNRGMLI